MRYPRIKPDPDVTSAFFHLISKTVNGEFLFHDSEKRRLQRHLWLVAERCGIEIITFELLTNHFHIVAFAPMRQPLADSELLRRYGLLLPSQSAWVADHIEQVQQMLATDGDEATAWRHAERRKACNISEFMKLLKQRFSLWFNRTHDRFGTLWYERFKSVLLEPGRAVRRCMAYINTNAARAGICPDPTAYPFSAFAEALAGSERAQQGILYGLGVATWPDAIRLYRRMLLARAARPIEDDRKDFETGAADRDAEFATALFPAAMLHGRCRSFSDGAVLGSKAFVEEQLTQFRHKTGLGRRMRTWNDPQLSAGLVIMRRLKDPASSA